MGSHLVPDAHHDVPFLRTGFVDAGGQVERRRLGHQLRKLRDGRLARPWAESAVIAAISAHGRPVRRRCPVYRWQRLTLSQVTASMSGATAGSAHPAAGNDHKRPAATRLPSCQHPMIRVNM